MFAVLGGITTYQTFYFRENFECISDYQAIFLDSEGVFIGCLKTFFHLLANYSIYNTFLDPERRKKVTEKQSGEFIDCNLTEKDKSIETEEFGMY